MKQSINVRIDPGHAYSRPEYKEITVEVRGEVTDCMQMRLICEGKDYACFECGIDIVTTDKGSHHIISTTGIYGANFLDFAANYLMYRRNNYLLNINRVVGVVFCDDHIHDEENTVIDDENLLFRLI